MLSSAKLLQNEAKIQFSVGKASKGNDSMGDGWGAGCRRNRNALSLSSVGVFICHRFLFGSHK